MVGQVEEYWKNWKDVSGVFSKVDWAGREWHYVENVEFEAGKTYTLRPTINVPVQLGANSGKYDVCVWPSILSPQEAYHQDRIFCIDPWWNTSWNHKQPINISVPGGTTEENYQVKLEIDTSNNGTNWNWSNECVNSNSTRAKIVNATEDGELDFFVMNCSTTSETMTIWIETDDNITSTSTTMAYIYYGNTGGSTAGGTQLAGENTFELWDDFDDESINSSKWSSHGCAQGQFYEASDELQINITADSCDSWGGSDNGPAKRSDNTFSGNFTAEAKIRDTNRNSNIEAASFRIWGATGVTHLRNEISVSYGSSTWRCDNGVSAGVGSTYADSNTSYYKRITREGQNVTGWGSDDNINWFVMGSYTYSTALGGVKVGHSIVSNGAYTMETFVDWIRVRKRHSDGEPTVVLGSEETYSIPAPLSISLSSPSDGEWQPSQTVSFSYTPDCQNCEILNCSLWTDDVSWSRKEWNASDITNGSSNSISETFSGDGDWLWTVSCYNASAEIFAGENRTVRIDSYPPTWHDNSTNGTEAGTWIEHRVAWTDGALLKGYIFSFDNGTESFVNDSWATLSGTEDWVNVTKYVNNTEGAIIRWRVYVNDTGGNWNATDIFQYSTTDQTPPEIIFNSPSSNGTTTTNNWVYVNVSISETPDTCLLDWNGTNITMKVDGLYCHKNQTGLSDVGYYFSVWANDTSGNLNMSDGIYIDVDATPPDISWNHPSINTTQTFGYIYVNVSVSENPNSCLLDVNGTNESMTIDGSYCYFNKTGLGTGGYYLEVYANDSAGNLNVTDDARYIEVNPTQFFCDSCASCSGYLQNGSMSEGDTLYLSADITGTTSDCVVFSGMDDITFDCQAHNIGGSGSGTYGILLNSSANNNTVKDCSNISYFTYGITIARSENNTITDVAIGVGENMAAFYLYNTSLNIIDNSTINVDSYGIYFWNSSNNTIENITLGHSNIGIALTVDTSWNTINDCVINGSEQFGVWIVSSGGIVPNYNSFYNNNFTQNVDDGSIDASTNYFNTTKTAGTNIIGGPYIGGNYWDSYSGSDFDGDGIGGTNHTVYGTTYDDLPLVLPSFGTITATTPDGGQNWTFSATAGSDELVTISFASTGNVNNTLSFTLTGDLDNTSLVSINSTKELLLDDSEPATFNFSINASCPDDTYYGNITWSSENSTQTGILEFNFTIDSSPPDISFNEPASNNSVTNRDWIYVNVSVSETPDTCLLEWNGSNESMTEDGLYCHKNQTGLSDGGYYFVVWANDTLGNLNFSSGIYAEVDTTQPAWQDNSTNGTDAGTWIQHSLRWTDGRGLSGYVFSFDNGSGSFVNDSWTTLSGTEDWANITKYVNETVGSTIRWLVYVNDTGGNWNVTGTFSYATTDESPPYWSGNETNIVAAYSPGTLSYFNVTWDDRLSDIQTVFIQTNLSGSDENHSMYTGGNGIYQFNFSVAAGVFYWKSWANDTEGNLKVTDTWVFSVAKAENPIFFHLNSSQANLSIIYGDMTNATGHVSHGSVSLYRNDSVISNPELAVLHAGLHVFKANTSGNQNYTSNSTYYQVSIARRTAGTELEITPASPITYGTGSTVTCQANNREVTANLYRNATLKNGENATETVLPAGGWEYVCNCSETQNYTTASNSTYYQVNKAQKNVTLHVNGSAQNLTQTYPDSVNASAYVDAGSVTIYLNGSSVSNAFEQILTAGKTYNFTAVGLGDDNYTGDSETYFVNVKRASTAVILHINGSESGLTQTYPDSVNVSAYSNTSTPTLHMNGSAVSNPYEAVLTAGYTYNFKAFYGGDENHTGDSKTFYVNVNRASMPIHLYINGSASDHTADWGSTTNTTGYKDYSEGSFDLLLNGSSLGGSQHIAQLGAGYWNYTLAFAESQNYTANGTTLFVTINKAGSETLVYLNGSLSEQTYDYGETPNATAYCDYGSLTLYRNISVVSNPEVAILPAGYWNYTAYCAGDANHTASENTTYATVNKVDSTTTLHLNGTGNNLTQTYPDSINASAYCDFGTLSFYVNASSLSSPFQQVLTAQYTYNFSAYCSGDDNHTATEKTYFASVKRASTSVTLLVNGSADNLSQNYPDSVNISAYTNTSTVTLHLNSTAVSNPYEATLTAGYTYNFTSFEAADQNHTGDLQTFFVNVGQGNPNIVLLLNGTDDNLTIDEDTKLNITVYLDVAEAVDIYVSDSPYESGNAPLENLSTFATPGTYNVTAYYGGSQNYTASSSTHWLTVSDVTFPSVVITSPENITYSATSLWLNWTFWDNVDSLPNWCAYSLNRAANDTSICPGGTIANTSITAATGDNNVTICANDSAGNMNCTTRYFHVFIQTNYSAVQQTPVPYDQSVYWNVTVQIQGSGLANYTGFPSDYINTTVKIYNTSGGEISAYGSGSQWVSWNATAGESNYTIQYQTGAVSLVTGTAIQGSASIGAQTAWNRTDSLTNPVDLNYSSIQINFSLPTDAASGTIQVFDGSGNQCPHAGTCGSVTEEIPSGYAWIYVNLSASAVESWRVSYNTSEVNYTAWNETVSYTWYGYMNVSKNATDLSSVSAEMAVNESMSSIAFQLKSAGVWLTKTTDASYSFSEHDDDGNGSTDRVSWTIPALNELKQFRVYGSVGIPVGVTENTTITNPPVTPYKNIEWKNEITLNNTNPTSVSYSRKIRPPSDAFNIKLDGTSVQTYWDENGIYVTLSDTIAGDSSVIHTVTYKTDAVTLNIYYNYPEVFYTDEEGEITLNLSLKNLASENISDVEENIFIDYGEDAYLCEGFVDCGDSANYTDHKSIVSGTYVLREDTMEGDEIKTYTLKYSIPTAVSERHGKYRAVENGTTSVVHPVTVRSVAPIALRDVRAEYEDISCGLVYKIVGEEGLPYDWDCGSTIVELGAMDVGQILKFSVYEEEGNAPEVDYGWLWEMLNYPLIPFGVELPLLGTHLRAYHLLVAGTLLVLFVVLVKFGGKEKIRKRIRKPREDVHEVLRIPPMPRREE
nr:hypothetical protein 14 [bacterium]